MYLKTLRGMGIAWIPARVYPLMLFLAFICALFFPWSQRRGVWISVRELAISPFSSAKFRETFLADVITSMIKVLVDIVYTVCYFSTGASLCGVPVALCQMPIPVMHDTVMDMGAGQWKDDTMESCSNRYVVTHIIAFFIPFFPMVRSLDFACLRVTCLQ